jgi:hypothetical protein
VIGDYAGGLATPDTWPTDLPDDIAIQPLWTPDDHRDIEPAADVEITGTFPLPERRSTAERIGQPDDWLVDDLIRPGRIHVAAAEEGTGKSMAIDAELAIRVALAGGEFAGTWSVLSIGPVVYLSEMHPDDDLEREDMVLAALGRQRSELTDLYRLSLATAANGDPVLQNEDWRTFIVEQLLELDARLLIFDTATGAAQVEPWGPEIQVVYRRLRAMLDAVPKLAIVLIVHLKKPTGRGRDRSISDVLGEWGRWCDILMLFERDGDQRVKLSTRKRVRDERRVVATKRDGLLVDPFNVAEGSSAKVTLSRVVEVVEGEPGIAISTLAERLEVSKRTAAGYAKRAAQRGLIDSPATGPKRAIQLFPVTKTETGSGSISAAQGF